MTLAPDIVAGVSQRLMEHAGFSLPAWVVEARASARIAELGVSPSDYVTLIKSGRGAGELATLVEAVRVGESSLFRHRPQVEAIVDIVVPALKATGRRVIRVWSAGCASGEEPFTLAVVLSRALPGIQISITATDVSAEALVAARAASYPASALDDVPPEWRDSFVVTGDRMRVRPEIAALVTFERANLIDAVAPRSCDLVWCRNVLIYFSPDARRRAVDKLIGSLQTGGFLFVGYSETLRDIPELDTKRSGETVFYCKRERDRETTSPGIKPSSTPPHGMRTSAIRTAARPAVTSWLDDAGDARENTVISVPPPPALRGTDQVLTLIGQPRAQAVIALIGERLAMPGVKRLVIELDLAELLDDSLVPVLRRARSAGASNGVAIELRATKPGPKRWLSRHGLSEGSP